MKFTFLHTIALLLIPGIVLAEMETDHQLWTSSGIRYRSAKGWTIQGTQNIRFDKNVSSFQSFKPQLELSHSPYQWLEIGSGYRFVHEANKDSKLATAHRYHAQVVFERKWDVVKLSYRLRYQKKQKTEDLDVTTRIRNRIKLSYDTRTLFSPLLSAESFVDKTIATRKTRLTLGCAAKLSKSYRLVAGYQHQIYMDKDETARIFLLDFEYRMPKKKGTGEQEKI